MLEGFSMFIIQATKDSIQNKIVLLFKCQLVIYNS